MHHVQIFCICSFKYLVFKKIQKYDYYEFYLTYFLRYRKKKEEKILTDYISSRQRHIKKLSS